MALYQLECTCGHTEEVNWPMADFPPKVPCPKCKKKKQMTVVIQVPAVRAYYSPLHPRHRRGQGGVLREYGSFNR